MATTSAQTGYAAVNGLNMYYESHGTGQPLVLLHGAYGATSMFAQLLPTLTRTRQVITVDLQGHGRTADTDRPLSYEQMADDTAALLPEIGVGNADMFGYSMGGGVALQVGVRHPDLIRKLVVASATYKSEGMYPEVLAMIETITPEMFDGAWRDEYDTLAPNGGDFGALVAS